MLELREIDNVDQAKEWIDRSIISAFNGKKYVGKHTTLSIENPQIGFKDYSLDEQKRAILANKNLSRPVYGDIKLTDNETGKVIGSKSKFLLAQAPYHTGRNTEISNGSSYSAPANQLRLRPGAYTRKKANGEIETHFNLVSGTGSGFRLGLEPETGIFNLNLKTINAPLYPFLKAMGTTDEELKDTWGEKILNTNKVKGGDILKFYEKLVPYGNPNATPEAKIQGILGVFEKAKMDKEVTQHTLGKPIENVDKNALIESTKKILAVSNGTEEEDDRDSLLYKKIYSAEDFYEEKVRKDAGSLGKKLIMRLDRKKDIAAIPPGYFTKQLWGVIKSDPTVSPTGTLAQPIEEINPVDLYDQHHKVTLMGEGGIGDMHVVTMEARNVHPSEFGFIDNIRTPESVNVGIDKRLALGTRKGSDNLLYKQFVNTKTGKREWLNPLQTSEKIIAFPGEWDSKKNTLQTMAKNTLKEVPRKEVEYYLPTAAEQYSTYDNLVPLSQSVQGNRMILAGKAISLTLPLKDGDAPLLQSQNPLTGNSFEKDIADKVVNKLSKVTGTIKKIDKNNIWIKDDSSGALVRHGLYNNFPLNLKTSISHILDVKEGDKVKNGDLLAHSNFSTKDGTLAIGKNLRSAYIPYKGWNFEDGIILSESAAKKLTSEQMYQYEYEIDDPNDKIVDKQRFSSMFPTFLNKDLLNKIDSSGVIKPGTVVHAGDPLILAMEKRPPSSRDIQLGNLHKSLKNLYRNNIVDWAHHSDGVVTDVYQDNKKIKVLVKTHTPASIGDKLTGRFGNKGVVSLILPDDKMPKVKATGEPLEILLNPVGIPSRINPGQNHEAALGKIALKTGKPYILPSFKSTTLIDDVEAEAKKHGVKLEDDLIVDGRELKDVFNGVSYIWKLSKMSEGEIKKRELGGYDLDQQPIKGKGESGQALKIGSMEINALMGHGAKEVLREISTIKGQKNDIFWRNLKLGYTLPTPTVPFVYDKFLTMLRGAGINVKKEGTQQHLMPLTDRDILTLSSGRIEKPEILYTKNLQPIKGGLFDMGITGGTGGQKWGHIKLIEPLPNPVMEDPIKKLLRINTLEFDSKIKNNTLFSELSKLNTEEEIRKINERLSTLSGAKKDLEYKRLMYLTSLKKNNIQPSELILRNVPVIPPIYRPVSVAGSAQNIQPGSANLLYKDLLTTNLALEGNKKELPDSELGSERMMNYKALKSVIGLGDPVNIKNSAKGFKGFIETIVGDQPKTGYFQKKVYNKTQDLVSRAVAAPDPTLSMDQISIPDESAWKLYHKFVIRRMIQNGINAIDAERDIEKKTPRAYKYLEAEMNERPLMLNRNPSLHKFNKMSFTPILNGDNVVKVSPPIVTGFALDFDGDMVNLFAPVTPEAVREMKEKMYPSKNLLHIKNREVHYIPSQGSVLGMYAMTKPPESKKITNVYNSLEDMKKDYQLGNIKANDLVELRR